ncbi:MAG: 50S ribosomal protein L18 [Patescibacteria group bacterium]|nr:50S ribosomal protein L18 [Patescibacteria group bacterium]MDE2589089.1 50S ribosomal protein L18 [Patescibacteria group bacterium]
MRILKSTRAQRKIRISMNVRGTEAMPRLSVARSNKHFQAQIINDAKGVTLVGVSEVHLKSAAKTKTEKAKQLGLLLAEEAKKHKVTAVVFDKGAYRYHGRVKAFAEGAREGGLKF